ncbi:MAG: methylenetetrahydrofolate reductase C-terminal domain-containing protein [Oscillospiraceae bacterium]|nr:methylenetetrahydrofolate reductase C-terminal domain-containing protein [Oscillospiraceae bacterium]
MIIAEPKKLADVLCAVEPYRNVAVAGCGTCVTVCLAGGEKEALGVAGMIRLAAKEAGREVIVSVTNPIRQCDMEFLDSHEAELEEADCILSLACGAGVQFMAEKFPDKVVVPGVDTKFIGVNRDLGYWTEMCQGCGNCILEKTGGVCPVSRCSKSHFNGPCGGSSTGKCEIDPETECGWQLIYDRLSRINQLDRLLEVNETRDWSTSRDGGPRIVRRQDVTL